MSWFRVLPAFLFSVALAANGPWADFLQRRRNLDPRQAKWTLCVRAGEFVLADAYKDPVFQKLLTSGDFALETLAAPAAHDLWSQRNWGTGAHWLLLSPGGVRRPSGSSLDNVDRRLTAGATALSAGSPILDARQNLSVSAI